MQLQFTIPFVNTHWTILSESGVVRADQQQLYISMAVYGESIECYDKDINNCETKVDAYKIQDTSKYVTGEWKVIHKIRVYNREDGDFTLTNRHITLRFETGSTSGNGSKIFENLILPDIQVLLIISIFFNYK